MNKLHLYYCTIPQLRSFCKMLQLNHYIVDTQSKRVKLDNKCGLVDKIWSRVTEEITTDKVYYDWVFSSDSNIITLNVFKSENMRIHRIKLGNKSFRLADELWSKPNPITWDQFKSIYQSYTYEPLELRYNNSDHSTWSVTQTEAYQLCLKAVMKCV